MKYVLNFYYIRTLWVGRLKYTFSVLGSSYKILNKAPSNFISIKSLLYVDYGVVGQG